jgi:hypothetical protein
MEGNMSENVFFSLTITFYKFSIEFDYFDKY